MPRLTWLRLGTGSSATRFATGHQRNSNDSVSMVPDGEGASWWRQAVPSLPVLSCTMVKPSSRHSLRAVMTAVVAHRNWPSLL